MNLTCGRSLGGILFFLTSLPQISIAEDAAILTHSNTTEARSSSGCDNISEIVCDPKKSVQKLKKVKVLQENLNGKLEEAFNQIHGGKPQDLILDQLKKEGFEFKDDAKEEIKTMILNKDGAGRV